MTNPLGFCVAILATTSLVLASGEGDKKGGEKSAKKTSTPSVLQGQWSGGAGQGIGYTTKDFALRLRSGVQLAFNYDNLDSAADTTGFDVRRARTSLSGHVYSEDITFKLQNEWNDAASIKDAWVDWRFHHTDSYAMALRLGQMKTRFGKEWNTSYSNLEHVNRSLATRTFSGSRSRAAMVHGTTSQDRLNWSVALSNTEMASIANNAGEEGNALDNADNELNWTFDLSWTSNPKAIRMGGPGGALDDEQGFGVGLAYYLGNGRNTTLDGNGVAIGTDDTETTSRTLWAAWKGPRGIAASAELFTRVEETVTQAADYESSGFSMGMSWTAPKVDEQAQWGVALRYTSISVDSTSGPAIHSGGNLLGGAANGDADELELVLNRYSHGHNLKTQLGVTHQSINPGTGTVDNYLFTLQTTLIF